VASNAEPVSAKILVFWFTLNVFIPALCSKRLPLFNKKARSTVLSVVLFAVSLVTRESRNGNAKLAKRQKTEENGKFN
jgi:hypothetical protein